MKTIQFLTDNEPDPSGPIGECRYNCGNAEHVGNHKYVCLHQDHWGLPPWKRSVDSVAKDKKVK